MKFLLRRCHTTSRMADTPPNKLKAKARQCRLLGRDRFGSRWYTENHYHTAVPVELENTRSRATRELEELRNRRERIEGLDRDKNALLESYAGMVPQALDSLTPQERHQIYKMLRVQVTVGPDGRVEVTGALCANPEVCNLGSAPGQRTVGTGNGQKKLKRGPRSWGPSSSVCGSGVDH
jgi:hypothetical protein